MKKALTIATALSLLLHGAPLYSAESALSPSDYEANEGYEKAEPLGYGSSKATNSAISMSMIGWGLGLAAAIAIVAGVIHQSAASHSSSSSDNS